MVNAYMTAVHFLPQERISHVHDAEFLFYIYAEECTPGRVTNIDFFADDTRIVMSWDEPGTVDLNPGNFIEGYEVSYNHMGMCMVGETIQTSWEVNYLLPDTPVRFEVKAKCSCGKMGPPVRAVHSTSECIHAILALLLSMHA